MDQYRVVDGRILNRQCEINVTDHCNLSCRGCSHLSPVLPKSFADPMVVRRDLTALSHSYHVRVLRLLGGEPLLHPELLAIVAAVRCSGICDSISVVTNGLLLPRMSAAFWAAIDGVDVSLYPRRRLSEENQRVCIERANEHGVAIRLRRCDDFQESYSETGTDDDDLVRRIYTTCNVAHRWRCHNIVDGWFYRCPQSHYIPKLLRGDVASHTDGLLIEDTPSFRDRLLAYLQSPDIPTACANCLGSSGRYQPHAQIRRREFRTRQLPPSQDLVDERLVGRVRVSLARVESHLPQRVVIPLGEALRSPALIGLLRKAQSANRALLRTGAGTACEESADGGQLSATSPCSPRVPDDKGARDPVRA